MLYIIPVKGFVYTPHKENFIDMGANTLPSAVKWYFIFRDIRKGV